MALIVAPHPRPSPPPLPPLPVSDDTPPTPMGPFAVGTTMSGHTVLSAAARARHVTPRPVGASAPPSVVVSLDAPIMGPHFVSVRRDGSDGDTLPVRHDGTEIGRSASVSFADDPFLAALHARIERVEGAWRLVPIDRKNGVFIRLREPHDIVGGDVMICGRQVFRFEILEEAEVSPGPAMEHGVLCFGTPPRPAWGRLCQVLTAGTARDVYHLTRDETIIGREDGDIRYPEDEFLSRRHAAICLRGSRTRLEDMGSSNGTYVRLRGPRELRSGDLVRLGNQLLRFEP